MISCDRSFVQEELRKLAVKMEFAPPSLQPYGQQVAGSFPLLKREDGEVCKPATKKELYFYDCELVKHPEFAKFVPRFLGKVKVQEDVVHRLSQDGEEKLPMEPNDIKEMLPTPPEKDDVLVTGSKTPWSYSKLVALMENKRNRKIVREKCGNSSCKNGYVYLVLENLTNKLNFPHVLDLKVGTRQHGSHESAKKKRSKTLKCATTTSTSLGLRLGGIQMFDINGREWRRDKYYGRKLTEEKLKYTLQQFVSNINDVSILTDNEMKSNAEPKVKIIQSLVSQLDGLISAVKSLNWRFYGCSVLITFSGGPKNSSQAYVRVIDFANAEMTGYSTYDEGFVFGLENLRTIFKSTLDSFDQKKL